MTEIRIPTINSISELIEARLRDEYSVLSRSDAQRFRTVLAWLPRPPRSLLDVGCGMGVLLDAARQMGYETTGVDDDEVAMSLMESPHVTASIADLPFADRSFDTVVVSEVWEHLPVGVFEPGRSEVARVARDHIVLTTPNAESLESASTRCPMCSCVYSIHGHVRRFEPDDLETLIPGWRLVRRGTTGPFKVRHRFVEWTIRRRLLGMWPPRPGATCPQCSFAQPGSLGEQTSELGARGGIGRAMRTIAGVPWHRWWLIAEYERKE